MRNFDAFGYNGREALASVIESSEFGSIEQAVAALAVFAHPATVAQTRGLNIFRVVRARSRAERGTYIQIARGDSVMLDDNTAPTNAFTWAHNLARNGNRLRDVQFNHVWPRATDVSAYTNLTNLCMMPAFLSKLSDTDTAICELLRYRAWHLYKHCIQMDEPPPEKPGRYRKLCWAQTLPPMQDLEKTYREAMRKRPKNNTTRSARELGWLFSEFRPDPDLNGGA